MVSRLVYSLGCFPVTRCPVQSCRFLSCNRVLWNADQSTAEPLKPVVKPSTNNGGGISGFLRDKTGVTGPWMLGTGVAAYCLSKEVYVITSETLLVMVLGTVLVMMVKKIGKPFADFLDAKSQAIHDLLSGEKNAQIAGIKDALDHESKMEGQLSIRHDIFEILEENNAMRREEEYRRRLHQVSDTVRRRLNYQVEVEQVQRKFEQLHMIQWLEQTVKESVGKQDESFDQCLGVLKKMSAA